MTQKELNLSLRSEVGHNLQLQQSLSTSVAVDLAGPSMCDLMTQWVEWNFRYMLSTSNIHVHTYLPHKLKKLPRCLPRWPRWMPKGFFDALLLLAGWIELADFSAKLSESPTFIMVIFPFQSVEAGIGFSFFGNLRNSSGVRFICGSVASAQGCLMWCGRSRSCDNVYWPGP